MSFGIHYKIIVVYEVKSDSSQTINIINEHYIVGGKIIERSLNSMNTTVIIGASLIGISIVILVTGLPEILPLYEHCVVQQQVIHADGHVKSMCAEPAASYFLLAIIIGFIAFGIRILAYGLRKEKVSAA